MRICRSLSLHSYAPRSGGDDCADVDYIARGREPERQRAPLLGRPAVIRDDGRLPLSAR
jgi:hypothetical protein